jgi:hypothetical protein
MQAVIADDFHVLFDLVDQVGRNHGETLCTWPPKKTPVLRMGS